MMFVLPSSLLRSTLLQIHARQHNLPLPYQTPSPAKRTTILRSLSPTRTYPQGVRIVQGPKLGTSPNGTEYSQQGEIDLSLDSAKEIKPQYSYALMIAQAILSVPEQKMQLSKIYEFIMSRYAFYRYTKSGWQNSIRHNLSLNKAFIKVPRRTDEPGKGMKWQIADEYIEEFVAKVHRTMTPRPGKKFVSMSNPPSTTSTSPDQQSPIRTRYPGPDSTPIRGSLQVSLSSDYLLSPSLHHPASEPMATTPERATSQRQFMPMSSPAPFYRYSSASTPAHGTHERSSPPSSGAIDLAETLVEFSSPVKHRETFARRISSPLEGDESPSRALQNGIKSSLGDLQGVDLLRGFEKISTWREGSSPIKDYHSDGLMRSDVKSREPEENGFAKEPKKNNGHEGVNGIVAEECIPKPITPPEDMESEMTDVRMEDGVRE